MTDHAFGRVLAVLVSPAATFRSIASRPTWLAPALVVFALGLVSTVLSVPKVDWRAVAEEQMASGFAGQMSEAQLDQQIELTARVSSTVAYVLAVVGVWVVLLLLALLFWIAFRFVGGELRFGASLAVTAHSFMPHAVAALLAIPLLLGRTEVTSEELQRGGILTSSLAFLAPEGSRVMAAFLGSFDLFSLWALALFVIGYRAVAKVSTAAAVGTVGGLWLVWVVGRVGLTAVAAALTGAAGG